MAGIMAKKKRPTSDEASPPGKPLLEVLTTDEQAKQPPAASPFRDRVKELRRVRAAELITNDKNWRTHPQAQQDALSAVLRDVGYADALLAREREDGALVLIDGHLRKQTTPDAIVPVLVLDVTAEEADKLLATVDPLAAMAETNRSKLDDLLATIQFDQPALVTMLDNVSARAAEAQIFQFAQTADEDGDEDGDAESDDEDGGSDFKNFSVPLTVEQERVVRQAIKEVKSGKGADTTGEALFFIVQEWLWMRKGQHANESS